MATIHTVEATNVTAIQNGYRLKISVLDLGLYINGFTIRRSEVNTTGWWVQAPANNKNGKWFNPAEFDKSKSLWVEIEKACIDAANLQDSVDKYQ